MPPTIPTTPEDKGTFASDYMKKFRHIPQASKWRNSLKVRLTCACLLRPTESNETCFQISVLVYKPYLTCLGSGCRIQKYACIWLHQFQITLLALIINISSGTILIFSNIYLYCIYIHIYQHIHVQKRIQTTISWVQCTTLTLPVLRVILSFASLRLQT